MMSWIYYAEWKWKFLRPMKLVFLKPNYKTLWVTRQTIMKTVRNVILSCTVGFFIRWAFYKRWKRNRWKKGNRWVSFLNMLLWFDLFYTSSYLKYKRYYDKKNLSKIQKIIWKFKIIHVCFPVWCLYILLRWKYKKNLCNLV